jgi:glycosyltransferase involved in cell wall biosynthesis
MAPRYRAGNRRVLMLAYYFPPLGGSGVQRTVKFAKYLPYFGWRSTVLTTGSRSYPATDPGLAAELPPSTRVRRARELPGATLPVKVLSRLGLRSAARLAAFPDDAVGWAPDALRQALRLVRSEEPAVLMSTSAPFSAHLVAMAVHERTGIPWVADFRDEWSANPHLRDDPEPVRRAARRLEHEITARAAAVTFAADYFAVVNAGPRPFVIPNGVDDEDLRDLAPPERHDDLLRLTFVGTLYGDQDAAPFFAALARLVARGAIDADRVRVRIVGNDWLPRGQLTCPVEMERTGYVAHREALQEMASASVLVHYVALSSRAPGGKIYEYLASARPILCVARSDGRAAALVRESAAGPVAAPDAPDAIEQAILELYRRWLDGGLTDQPRVREWTLARYSRRQLTGDLAAVLDHAVAPAVAG